MAAKLLPAVLATSPDQFRRRLRLALDLQREIHIDVMDGKFVSTRSVGPSLFSPRTLRIKAEYHLMVLHPAEWIPMIKRVHGRRAILHVERQARLADIIRDFRRQGISVSLAISMGTPIARIKPYLRLIRALHVMAVRPGRYQARFLPQAVSRISLLHRRYPRLPISVDGGMNRRTIPLALAAGAQRIVVGSGVMLSAHPRWEWQRLQALIKAS